MKYIEEYRDGRVAQTFAAQIAGEVRAEASYRFMEFCGGHTHAISRFGIADLLPANVRMIHGPGCPVCVLPVGRIDMAIGLAERPEVTLCTYGDLMRVPGSHGTSLLKAKAAGADIRMVYSTLDTIRIAEAEPSREVVFFAIGFETTTPPTALAIRLATLKALKNFSVFCNHVLTPSAIQSILESPDVRALGRVRIDGFIGPSHVSTVIGTQRLLEKRSRREMEEAAKPLERYRAEELERMRLNFYGFDPSYHVARYNFIHKIAKSRTPATIARHRARAMTTIPQSA